MTGGNNLPFFGQIKKFCAFDNRGYSGKAYLDFHHPPMLAQLTGSGHRGNLCRRKL